MDSSSVARPDARDAKSRVEGSDLPADVARLIVAARIVAFEQTPEAIRELDEASEAFADRVPWDSEPEPVPAWVCTRCGRDEIDCRENGCERGPCPMVPVR